MHSGRGGLRALAIGVISIVAIAGCGSGSSGSPAATTGASGAPTASTAASGGPGPSSAAAHTTAIEACSVLDEATVSQLVGYPVKYFGAGDPVARVPFTDKSYANQNGDALHQSPCGYWETGVNGELSRDVVTTIFQGDPAKPGSATTTAAHGQFAIMQGLAASLGAQPVPGIGDEAFAVTSAGGARLVVRAGDLVVTVESLSPPDTTKLTVDNLAGVVRAILARV